MSSTVGCEFYLFNHAREKVEDCTDVADGLSSMIHLAFNATHPQLRRWASNFLNASMSVQILENDYEAAREAGCL
ncbi:hypothetical protein UFOVP4_53 [uncultured Caudovirales phage]|uniref:Uncharacterized protein n=1 Tax=uncultured Caudovirales phage TaxID=2100421 RepID=A0A6J5KHJ4_9CAUD|nr:hypothetical protein UFOVP4_53 [uncultured Caudovirales phage]CAB4241235.1 hypothetical protein UFOVP64_7 [uncultured Caudovirales phage]CAB5078980.1 hypothetical protein UFOVP145_21 [uncultured Caudovirales phage]